MNLLSLRFNFFWTAFLIVLQALITQKLDSYAGQEILAHPVWQNLAAAAEIRINSTMTDETADEPAGNATLVKSIPWTYVFCRIILVPLQYYWHTYLERTWPSRETRVVGQQPDGDSKGPVDGGQVSQDQVRRRRINWANTLLKWILGQTLGKVLYSALFAVLTGLVGEHEIPSLMRFVFILLGECSITDPIVSLVALIAVPAAGRVALVASIAFVETVWISFSLRFFAASVMNSQWGQDLITSLTDMMKNDTNSERPLIEGKAEL